MFEQGLKDDPICKKLYNVDLDDDDCSHASDSSCIEEPIEFDEIIKIMNDNLQLVFQKV